MQADQSEVLDFFRRHPPFSNLPDKVLGDVANNIEVAYYRAKSDILPLGQDNHQWYVIRSGAVEVFRRDGKLYNRLKAGEFFGEQSLMLNRPVRFPVTALEDTLVYLISKETFNYLFDNFEHFADFVEVEDQTRLRQSMVKWEDDNTLLTAKVATLITALPVTVFSSTTVHQAAIRMTEENLSSLLIIRSEQDQIEHEDPVIGIITDLDIREHMVAQGLSSDIPVADIMTSELIYVQSHQFVFEAMMLMLKHNVQHLPVLKKKVPIGLISHLDILRYESQNSLFVVKSIYSAQSVDELAVLTQGVQGCFTRMVHQDANSQMIGSAMAVVGRSFKQRLCELGEMHLGPPPVPYCFLALGSMARGEQLIVTDQDNALILDNNFDPKLHDEYFRGLAAFVSDGLARCGYSYCTGNIMASNIQWRQPLAVWQQYFSQWIEQPSAESLLHSAIFFDLEGVWGQIHWAEQLNVFIRQKAQKNPRFLACMARNALLRTPPLGFFKDFVMETDGRQTNSINMKRRGTAPIADLVRLHALAVGSSARNTFDRLEDIIEAGILPPGRGLDLRDALEFIAMVRIRDQAVDIELKREPDNNIEPENLSDFERKNLKEAFQILSSAQRFMKFRYQLGRVN
ncbi:putative nucleotidyltransferase substrate binding domain-containing protein [Zhongshania sp.]|jgi:CBS domain-containing protein|uniref:putative nucleotidyltransferase substrate binding domain-containing protein n=1 Tax=Zhongshania sp. TaxID=1971902 RepID=UPI0039E5259D